MHRVREALLWGRTEDIWEEPGFALRKVSGAFGALYQVEVSSPWRYWRMLATLAMLPPGARWLVMPTEEDEEDEGELIIYYWEDVRSRVKSSQISKPVK